MAFLSLVTDSTVKAIKAIGIRDWLICVLVLFLMAIVYGVQRTTVTMLAAHAQTASETAERVKTLTDSTNRNTIFLYVSCLSDAGASDVKRQRCDMAMRGQWPYR